MAATYTFDAANGSDTQASGYARNAGLAAAAASGDSADMSGYILIGYGITLRDRTNSSDPEMLAVTEGDKIWVGVASGRAWYTIEHMAFGDQSNGDDCWVAVVSEGNGTSSASGLNWGIGGSRNTFAGSLQLFADIEAGETILGQPLSTSGQTQTLTSTISITAAGSTTSGPIIFNGNGVTLTSATSSVDLITFSTGANYWRFENLNATHTGATRGNFINDTLTAARVYNVLNCTSNGCLRLVYNQHEGLSCSVVGCEGSNSTLSSSTDGVFSILGSSSVPSLLGCYAHDNPSCCGIAFGGTSAFIGACVIAGNGHHGFYSSTTSALNLNISGSTIVANGGDNIHLSSTAIGTIALPNNIIFGAGGYNVSFAGTQEVAILSTQIAYNAVGGATSGNYDNFQGGIGPLADVAIDSTYFVNYADGNYQINQANVSGLLVGYPQSVLGQTSLLTMGAQQLQPAASGGGGSPGKMGLSI